jgi:hypothetical protein
MFVLLEMSSEIDGCFLSERGAGVKTGVFPWFFGRFCNDDVANDGRVNQFQHPGKPIDTTAESITIFREPVVLSLKL